MKNPRTLIEKMTKELASQKQKNDVLESTVMQKNQEIEILRLNLKQQGELNQSICRSAEYAQQAIELSKETIRKQMAEINELTRRVQRGSDAIDSLIDANTSQGESMNALNDVLSPRSSVHARNLPFPKPEKILFQSPPITSKIETNCEGRN